MTYGCRIDIAQIEREDDPKAPGRTGYRVTAKTFAAVQDAIDTISNTVDASIGGVLGMAQFTPIIRTPDGFGCLGVVTKEQP